MLHKTCTHFEKPQKAFLFSAVLLFSANIAFSEEINFFQPHPQARFGNYDIFTQSGKAELETDRNLV